MPETESDTTATADDGTDTTETSAESASTTTTSAKTFTQEEVGKMLAAERKKARDAERARNRREAKTETTQDAGDSSVADDMAALRKEIDSLRSSLAIRDALGPYTLTDGQRTVLEQMAAAAAPEDLGTWLKTTVESLGIGKTETTTQPTRPIASDRGGPSGTPESIAATGSQNPLRWTGGDVERIMAGAKNQVDGAQRVRQKFLEGLRHTTISLPKSRG